MPKIKRNILLNPGPATTTDSVKYAMVIPDICPREREFQNVLESTTKGLVKIAGGGDCVAVLLAGSGTAGMDACISSVIAPGKKILIINNGAYGERLCEIALAYSIALVEFACPWHQTPNLHRLEQVIQSEPEIDCIAMVHHETSTGLLNPLFEVGVLAKRYNKTYLVDAISSFAGIPFNVLDNHIDYLVSSSNKCIQGMAGIAFVICRRSAIERTNGYPLRSYYLNLYKHYDYMAKTGQMLFTAPVQVIYALNQAVLEFLEEGAITRHTRYTMNWQMLRKGLERIGFSFLLEPEQESHILTTVLEPETLRGRFKELHDLLFDRGFTIYPGKLEGQQASFRLSVMGNIDKQDIARFLHEFERVLRLMDALPIPNP